MDGHQHIKSSSRSLLKDVGSLSIGENGRENVSMKRPQKPLERARSSLGGGRMDMTTPSKLTLRRDLKEASTAKNLDIVVMVTTIFYLMLLMLFFMKRIKC